MKTFYWKRKWKLAVVVGTGMVILAVLYHYFYNTDGETQWINETESMKDVDSMIEDSMENKKKQIAVHVSGAVCQPDCVLYLDEGSRMVDAIKKAGGETKQADLSQLNLASLLKDGQKIYVPRIGETIEEGEGYLKGENQQNCLTNINLATTIELDLLPGIGEAIAKRIVEYREEHGSFQTIEDLMKVKGIGENLFEELKDLITV